jgi:hypothetical protein
MIGAEVPMSDKGEFMASVHNAIEDRYRAEVKELRDKLDEKQAVVEILGKAIDRLLPGMRATGSPTQHAEACARALDSVLVVTQPEALALADWAAENKPGGLTAWGPKFSAALDVGVALMRRIVDKASVDLRPTLSELQARGVLIALPFGDSKDDHEVRLSRLFHQETSDGGVQLHARVHQPAKPPAEAGR